MAPQTSSASLAASPVDLSQIWGDLVSGRSQIIENFSSNERSYLALSLAPEPRRRPAEACFRLLQRILLGVPQKTIAIEAGVAPSTVAAACRQALAFMGLSCRPSKVPPLLCLIAQAACRPDLVPDARVSDVGDPGDDFRTLAAPRLEQRLPRSFSPAQTRVLGLLLDGLSYREIAQQRGTSMRTIANQVASVTRALNVSGRIDLIRLLTTQRCRLAVGEGPVAAS